MTAPQAGGAGRLSTGLPRPTTAGAALPALLLLLLLGFALRITIAYVLLPGSGFSSDVGTFAAWANRLADLGLSGFYAPGYFVDYPPGYMYVLWLVGGASKALSLAGGTTSLVKLPPMLADIGVAFITFHIVRGWLGKTNWADRLALIAAAIYLFNPVTWYDSAIWGQTDAIGAFVIVLGLAALIRGNSEGAAGLAVLAALVKPQFGVVMLPLVAMVLLKRHLLDPGSGPRNSPWAPAGIRSWLTREQGFWRLVSAAVVGVVVLFVVIIPFGLDIPGLIGVFARAAGGYEFLSINAYNPWALIGSNGSTPLAFGGVWNGSPDTVPLLGPVPGVLIGGIFLVAGYLVAMVRIAWREDRRTILVVGTFLALAFFMLPTRVHERYMFPVFAILPILAVIYRRWILVTVLLSVAAFINLHGVLTTPLYATPNIKDLPLGEFFREPVAIVFSIILSTVAFVLVVLELRPSRAVAAQAEEAALVSDSQVERAADGVAIPAGAAVALAASAAARAAVCVTTCAASSPPSCPWCPSAAIAAASSTTRGRASSTGSTYCCWSWSS